MSSWTLLNFSQRASTCLLPHLIPLGIIKIPLKEPKRPIFHLLRAIAWPPGGQLQKLTTPAVGLCPQIIPAKFRPNPSIFKTTFVEKTGERRRTPPQLKSRFATYRGGFAPSWGVASRPLLLNRTALKKGTTSLRSVVKKSGKNTWALG